MWSSDLIEWKQLFSVIQMVPSYIILQMAAKSFDKNTGLFNTIFDVRCFRIFPWNWCQLCADMFEQV